MKFVFKIITFFLLFWILYWILITVFEYVSPVYDHTNTSVLHDMPNYRKFDLLLLGTSHARMFALDGQKSYVEKVLDKNYFSLANLGTGVLIEKMMLEIFYSQKNEAKTIVYFVDPWVFYSSDWNEKNYYLNNEVFRVEFLIKMVLNGFSPGVIREYVTKKITYKLFILPINKNIVLEGKMTEKDKKQIGKDIQERLKLWYPQGTEKQSFEKYSRKLEELISLANEFDSKIIFIVPPTLVKDLPGKKRLLELLREMKKKYGVEYYDFSDSVKETQYYLNFDHLNFSGVKYFSKNFLKQIL